MFSLLENNTIPLIFGVGGRTLEEIDEVVTRYRDKDITLMVGFQSYPSKLEDIKLGRIKEFCERYPGCTVGYADHSSYDDEMAVTSNEYAYLLGARVFEKHIALDEGKERIDFQSAVGIEKISKIIERLRCLDGLFEISNVFDMTEAEINYRNRQKVPVAKQDLDIGHILTEDDIELKMIDVENAIDDIRHLLNLKLKNDVRIDCAFFEKDIQ